MSTLTVVAAIPLVACGAAFGLSLIVNKNAATERLAASSLAVLTGLLTALAILIPLGAALLPESKVFGWQEWLLVGGLFVGVACVFGTIYCMIGLQDAEKFVLKTKPAVPGWTNASWIALGALALGTVMVRFLPSSRPESSPPAPATSQTRFTVVRDLPELRTQRQQIEAAWGSPSFTKDHEIIYRTRNGLVVFCLDRDSLVQTIVETQEGDINAVGTHCKPN